MLYTGDAATAWAFVPLFLALLAFRRVSHRELLAFAWRYRLEVVPADYWELAPAIRRLRGGRLGTAAVGLSVYPVCLALGLHIPDQQLLYGLSAYWVGALFFALLPGVSDAGPRSAALVPRSAGDYLPRKALVGLPLAALVSIAAAVVAQFVPPRGFANAPSDAVYVAIMSVSAVALTAVAVRVLVNRRQAVRTPKELTFDDALRAQALHTVTGAGLALALVGTGLALLDMAQSTSVTWLFTAGHVAGLAVIALAVAAWLLRGSVWRVRRQSMA